MRQRDAERGWVGGDAVGDEEGVEDAVDRDGVDGHLRPVDQLLDEADLAAGGVESGRDRGRQLGLRADEGEAALSLAVGRLDDARDRQPLDDAGDELRARLGHARLGEAVALARLRRRERGGGPVDRVRQRQPLGDARGDADRPVRARRDDPVDVLGPCEPVDAGLVLGRNDRPLVRVREAGRRGVAVDGDQRRDRARVRRAAARSAQAPRLGRGDAVARGQSPPPHLVLAVPLDRLLQALLEAGSRAPAGQALELVGRADVPVDLAEPLVDEDDLGVGADGREHRVGHVAYGDVDPGGDVDDLAGEHVDVGGDDRLDRLGVVVDVEPVAGGVPVAVDRQRLARERLGDEARDHLLRMLARSVVVEGAHDHDRQPVGDEVRVREPVASRLRRRIGRARVERMLLVHGRVLRRPVHLARGDQDEALDRRAPDRVEQDLRPLHVRRHELGRALLDRLLHVRLGRRVDDHVDLADELLDQLRIADVPVHEREPLVAHHVREILEVARVGERVERDDLVVGVRQQVADEVRGDEAGSAGDENALAHSSSEIE